MPIAFAYNDLHKLSKAKATLMKHLQTRLRLKFPGRDSAIKYMHTIRASNTRDGTEIFLTFLVMPNAVDVELVDVEVAVPIRKLPENPSVPENTDAYLTAERRKSLEDLGISKDGVVATEDSIYCDATKLEHMVGLTMACEYAATQIKAEMIAAPSNLAAFEEAAAIVRKYTREFTAREASSEFEATPMHVNAAVYTAMNALQEMQQIEISISKDNVKKYTDKLTRAGRPAQAEALAIQEITPIVNELEKIRSEAAAKKGNWFKKKFASAKKSRLDKQLDEWKIAIENYLNAQPEGTKFAQADALIRKGKSPLAAAAEM
jgi:hypothetical protein